MPVVAIQTKDGPVIAFICGGPRPKRCPFCGVGYVSKLCDFQVRKGKTCDWGMCEKCATGVGPDQDYCPDHKNEAPPPQQFLFGESDETAHS